MLHGSSAPINTDLHTLRHSIIDFNAVTMIGPCSGSVLQLNLVRGNRGYNTSIFVSWNGSISCSYSTNVIRQLTKHGLTKTKSIYTCFYVDNASKFGIYGYSIQCSNLQVKSQFQQKCQCAFEIASNFSCGWLRILWIRLDEVG